MVLSYTSVVSFVVGEGGCWKLSIVCRVNLISLEPVGKVVYFDSRALSYGFIVTSMYIVELCVFEVACLC